MSDASPEIPEAPEPTESSKPTLDPRLTAVLAEREVPCPACGYNLRGLRQASCPECGEAVTWDALLNRETGVSLAWVVGLIGLAVSLPESILKWQRLAFRRLFFYGEQFWGGMPNGGYTQPDATILNPWFVGSTLYWHLIPLAIVGWWLMRKRIARWPWWLRWGVGLGCVVAALLGHRRLMWWYYDLGYGGYAPWPLWFID
ncbi:MAG: hypothetical protein AAF911_08930 [Planctomycetota bacterium]